MPARLPDQTGARYGRLTVTADDYRFINQVRIVTVQCECGTPPRDVRLSSVRHGHVKSCGCLHSETAAAKATTHGMSANPLHKAWRNMMSRCARGKHYKDVSVCGEWQTFEGFLANPPAGEFVPGMSVLGRHGDRGDYSPTNARWITKRENQREAHVKHSLDGEPAIDVARRNGLSSQSMNDRLKAGWTLRDAVTIPKKSKKSLDANSRPARG